MQECCIIVEVMVFYVKCLLVVLLSFCASMLCYSGLLVFHGKCLLVVLLSFYASKLCYSGGAGIPWLVLASGPCVLMCK